MKRALVIGGSMSGLLAGLALIRRGWDVSVHERVAEMRAANDGNLLTKPFIPQQLIDAINRVLNIS